LPILEPPFTPHQTLNWLKTDWRQETNNTVVVMGNVQKKEVTETGKVTSIVKNCEGGIQGDITLSDVMFLPNG
jgi:hypothetical protein